MDKLQEMEEQLQKYTGSIDEEGSAKFNEALDYVGTHLTPEVRERMTLFVEEGYEQCRKDILKVINSCEPEERPEVAERFYNMIMELRNKNKTE